MLQRGEAHNGGSARARRRPFTLRAGPPPPPRAGPPIYHFDLYRLTQPHELLRLDLPASFAGAVSLVEWAQRLAELPPQHLHVRIEVLAPREQRALEERGLAMPLADGEADDWGGDGNDSGSGDVRWRRIEFVPQGAAWEARLRLLRSYLLAGEGSAFGAWLLPSAPPSVSQG